MFDGGFAMGANLPLFLPGEVDAYTDQGSAVTTSTGEIMIIPERAETGEIAAGGLY